MGVLNVGESVRFLGQGFGGMRMGLPLWKSLVGRARRPQTMRWMASLLE